MNNNFCKNCGCPLNPNDKFCKNCGTAINNEQVMENNPTIPESNLNIYQNNTVVPRNNSWKYIVISLVVLLLVGGGVYYFLSKGNGSSSGNNESNNNSGGSQSSSVGSVYFKGFTFKIPSNYEYEIDDDTLSFSDEDDTWYSGLQVITSDYDLLVSSKNQVVSGIEARGYKINTYNQKVYSGLKCIVMEVEGMGQKMLLAYVRANSSKVFVVSVLNIYKDYDYDLFAKTIEIISTAV